MREGNNVTAISKAIEESKAQTDQPSLVIVHTHIGYGSPNKQDSFEAHGNPLGEEELKASKKALGWPSMDKFFLPEDAVNYFRQAISKGAREQQAWGKKFDAYKQAFPAEAAELEQMLSGKLPDHFAADVPKWKPEDKHWQPAPPADRY